MLPKPNLDDYDRNPTDDDEADVEDRLYGNDPFIPRHDEDDSEESDV